jgi:hypothetical protein
MSRNEKNLLKFLVAVAALGLLAYCVTREDLNLWHIAGIILSIDVGIWYCWHVFNDKE